MLPGEMNIDPIESEFFSTEALDSLSDALVRESIQNSLDARRAEETVRVRFGFVSASGDGAGKYFAGLGPHCSASGSGLDTVPDLSAPLDYLLVEDFGTRGLQGDPLQSEDEALDDAAPRNDFYYFWRNIGRSRKRSSDLGRWGLGKTVFPAASRINTFLALTVRADDLRRLVMGQSVLRIHKVDGARHYPYGYFGVFDGDFAQPVEDAEFITTFSADTGLSRSAEPGLSVLVPWPDLELTPESILGSVIRHYFAPILAGTLEIEIAVRTSGPASTEKKSIATLERLDATRLPEVLASSPAFSAEEASRLGALIELARFGQALPREHFVCLSPAPEMTAPRWQFEELADTFGELREVFDAGRPLAFSVPVWVKPIDREPALSSFDVFIQRDDLLNHADEHFLRDGVTVAGVRGGLTKGVRAIVIARDPPLAALLGDAENPAHTEWQERSPKFRNRYRHGPSTLRYVRNAPREIARALSRPTMGRNNNLLQHLFSLVVPTEREVVAAARESAGKTDPWVEGDSPEIPVTSGSGSPFILTQSAGGFCLNGTPNGTDLEHLAVRVAYEVRRGDPFAHYQLPDFDFSEPPIKIVAQGTTVTRAKGNLLLLRIDDPKFTLAVDGFDPRRDIRLRVVPAGPGP